MNKKRFRIQFSDIIFFGIIMITLIGAEKLIKSQLLVSIRTGEWMFTNKQIVNKDIFSFTKQGEQWVNHNWLSDLLSYLLYNNMGFRGITLFASVLIGISFVLIVRHSMQASKNHLLGVVLVIFGTYVSMPFWSAGNSVYNILFVSLYLIIFDKWENKKRRVAMFIFPLQILWVNINMDFMYGILIAFLFFLGELIEEGVRKKKMDINKFGKSILFILGLLLVSLINPYGIKVFMSLITAFAANYIERSSEWWSPDFHGYARFIGYFMIFIIFLIANKKENTEKGLKYFPIVIVLFAGALYSERNIIFFILCILMFLQKIFLWDENTNIKNEGILKIWDKMELFSKSIILKEKSYRINFGFLLFIVVFMIFQNDNISKSMPVSIVDYRYPEKIIKFMKENKIGGRGLCKDYIADYFIWEKYPKEGVFYDTRISFYNKFTDKGNNIIILSDGWQEEIEKWGIRWVLVSEMNVFHTALRITKKWTTVYKSNGYVLLIKNEYYANDLKQLKKLD